MGASILLKERFGYDGGNDVKIRIDVRKNTTEEMKLTIKNIDSIEDYKLPKLDGFTISWGKSEEHEYEFDIYYNHTLKMVLRVNRDSNYDGIEYMDNYTCTITSGGLYNNHKWQIVADRSKFGTKLGFLMVAGEMTNKILLQQAKEQEYLKGLPSVSANTPITQSYSVPF
jgi:hypothetical protein